MIVKNHDIELKDTSASEMARFRQIMLSIWRQQIEDDKNSVEMLKYVNEPSETAKTLDMQYPEDTDKSTLINGKEPISNWVKFMQNINNLISNAISGRTDSNRNCDMCCLNALASNLNALYNTTINIRTDDTLSSAVISLNAKNYKKFANVAPTYNGKRLTSRSHNDMSSDDLLKDIESINSNITKKLDDATERLGIGIFAVGMGAEYHSTIVIVSKDYTQKINIGGIDYVGTNVDPLYIYIEDTRGVRAFSKEQFEENMQLWVFSARKFYRGDKSVRGAKNGNKTADVSIDATIFQLKIE
jgi:hypothetical protein